MIAIICIFAGALIGTLAMALAVGARDRRDAWEKAWSQFTSGSESTGHPLMDCDVCGKWRGFNHVCGPIKEELK